MSEPSSQFESAIQAAEESVASACGDAVVEFSKWVQKEWKMSEDEWKRTYAYPPPTGDYWDGYNACLSSMEDAAAIFTGWPPR